MKPIYQEIWDAATPLCRWTIAVPYIALTYALLVVAVPLVLPAALIARGLIAIETVTGGIGRFFWRKP